MHVRTHIVGTAVNIASRAPTAALPLIPIQLTQVSLIPKTNPSVRMVTPETLMRMADGIHQGVALLGNTNSNVSWGLTQAISDALRVTQHLLPDNADDQPDGPRFDFLDLVPGNVLLC